MATVDIRNLTKAVGQLVQTLNPRNRDILSRRFGLKSGNKETLESIGKSYGITRERVRQIEEFALAQLSKTAGQARAVTVAVDAAKQLMAREGGVIRERALFRALSGSEKDSASTASLVFALTLDGRAVRLPENDRFHACWAADARVLDAFKSQAQTLTSSLEAHGAAMTADKLVRFCQDKGIAGPDGSRFDERHLVLLASVSRDIGSNIFGEMGLSHWSQIHPKGVRDKAYLVIKKSGKPQHFTAIAKLINQAKFDAKKTNVQTVHNELIKDERFVLVGRGMYALAEWGYKSGTVKDVLTDILRTHGKALPRTELISRVGQVRLVKENTILLNLQDSATFVRDEQGNYHLRKK
jgi:hypothetical protein